jgi:hypothetical protein
MQRFVTFGFVGLVGFASSVNAAATEFVTPDSPKAFGSAGWTRPTSDSLSASTLTTYQQWESWNFATKQPGEGPTNPPSEADNNANGSGDFYSLSGGIVAGSGNLYSGQPPGTIHPVADVPLFGEDASKPLTAVLVQLRSSGGQLDWDSMTVDFTDDNVANGVVFSNLSGSKHSFLLNTNVTFTPPGAPGPVTSYTQEHLWTFLIPDSPTSLFLDFGVSDSNNSTSIDTVAIDTAAVPEPAALAFGAVAGFGMLFRRSRRQG